MGFPSRRLGATLPFLATLVGCAGPGSSYRRVVDTTPRFGIHIPDSVRAGPYRPVFDKNAMHTSYYRSYGPGKPADLYIELPATVVRPKGNATRLRFMFYPSTLKGVERRLDWPWQMARATMDGAFQAEVPSGWRGTRLTLGGDVYETDAAEYRARIPDVAIERIQRETPPPVPLPDFRLRALRAQTIVVGSGVEVRTTPAPKSTIGLPAEIAWDSRQVLPRLPKTRAFLEALKTNVGTLEGYSDSTDPVRGSATTIMLCEGPGMDDDPSEIRMSFTLVKTRKRYSFEIPVRLDWVR